MVHICAQMTSVQTLWPACALTPSEIYTCRPSNDEGFGQIVPLSPSPHNIPLQLCPPLCHLTGLCVRDLQIIYPLSPAPDGSAA